jgi:hypothetical protein
VLTTLPDLFKIVTVSTRGILVICFLMVGGLEGQLQMGIGLESAGGYMASGKMR